jgi:hypothetical protein
MRVGHVLPGRLTQVRSGDTERAGRLDLLRVHRRRVLAQLDELQDDLAVID